MATNCSKSSAENCCFKCEAKCPCEQIFCTRRMNIPCMKHPKPRSRSFVSVQLKFVQRFANSFVWFQIGKWKYFFLFIFCLFSTKSLRITKIQNCHGSTGTIGQWLLRTQPMQTITIINWKDELHAFRMFISMIYQKIPAKPSESWMKTFSFEIKCIRKFEVKTTFVV